MGPASRRHLARDAPGGGGPQKVPRSGFATILYSHSRGHSRRVGAPRRLPGHPEGSQERFCSHSKVVGAPEGPWRRDGGGGVALLTTPYEGFVPFNQPLQGFWACRWPAPRRSGFNQPLRGGLSRVSQVVKSDARIHPSTALRGECLLQTTPPRARRPDFGDPQGGGGWGGGKPSPTYVL